MFFKFFKFFFFKKMRRSKEREKDSSCGHRDRICDCAMALKREKKINEKIGERRINVFTSKHLRFEIKPKSNLLRVEFTKGPAPLCLGPVAQFDDQVYRYQFKVTKNRRWFCGWVPAHLKEFTENWTPECPLLSLERSTGPIIQNCKSTNLRYPLSVPVMEMHNQLVEVVIDTYRKELYLLLENGKNFSFSIENRGYWGTGIRFVIVCEGGATVDVGEASMNQMSQLLIKKAV